MATINESAGAASVTLQRSPMTPSVQPPAASPKAADPPETKNGDIQDTVEVSEASAESARATESAPSGPQANKDGPPPAPQPNQLSGPSSDAVQPGSGTPDDPLVTNQRTSSETERVGNDGGRSSEATRTLGQVVDIFA